MSCLHVNNCQYLSCCCGARASHTLSTHTTQHLILRSVSYHRFYKHMCAQAITSRSITFATTRNTCAAKMSKIVSSLGHRAVLVSVECTRYTRALWRTLALYHGVQVTLRFWTFFQHLCLVWLLTVHQTFLAGHEGMETFWGKSPYLQMGYQWRRGAHLVSLNHLWYAWKQMAAFICSWLSEYIWNWMRTSPNSFIAVISPLNTGRFLYEHKCFASLYDASQCRNSAPRFLTSMSRYGLIDSWNTL